MNHVLLLRRVHALSWAMRKGPRAQEAGVGEDNEYPGEHHPSPTPPSWEAFSFIDHLSWPRSMTSVPCPFPFQMAKVEFYTLG